MKKLQHSYQNKGSHEKGDGSTKRAIRLGLEFASCSGKAGEFSPSSPSSHSLIGILLLADDLTLTVLRSALLLDLL